VAIAVAAALMAASVQAQEESAQTQAADAQAQSADSLDALQEIVVTAQFRQERLQDTPIAITAVNAEMLEQRSQTSIADVANQAPNVSLKPQSAAFGNSMGASIRGVGQYDFNPALEPGVGIYIDDVYYPTLTGANFDLLDLDRVEILRGPQGTLAGKNSIGGAVKLYSKKPNGEGGGYVSATYGKYNRTDIRASGDFAIVPETLFARVSGVSRNSDGYVKRVDYACANPGSGLPTLVQSGGCQLGTMGGQSYNAARGALRWIASDTVEVNLSTDITNDNSEVPATVLLAVNPTAANNVNTRVNGVPYDSRFIPTDKYTSYATFFDAGGTYGTVTKTPFLSPTRNTYDSWGVSGTVDWNLSDTLAVKLISGYREYESIFGNDNDASPLPVSQGQSFLTHHSTSQEARLSGVAFADKLDYTVGVYYFDQHTNYATHQDLLYVSPLFEFLGDDPVDASTKAGFLHAVYHVTDRLSVTGGYRYTDEDKEYTYSRSTVTGGPHPALGDLDGRTGLFEGTRSDYRANVDYKWTDDFMTYVQFSTGYKGGGINPRPFVGNQVQSFEPETLDAYEIGAKSALFDRKVRLNASVFYNEYADIQLTQNVCPQAPVRPCALPANAGDAEVKGVELETEIRPLPGLAFDASASFLDFEYTRIAPTVSGVRLGMITPYTPEKKYAIGAQYELPIGTAGSITPRIDASYQSEVFTNPSNAATNRIAPYTLVNARVTWRNTDETWLTALEVTNVTDKLYYVSIFDQFTNEGDTTALVGMPRAWALTVRRNF
jgi:iron complex outermembrane receptor protein